MARIFPGSKVIDRRNGRAYEVNRDLGGNDFKCVDANGEVLLINARDLEVTQFAPRGPSTEVVTKGPAPKSLTDVVTPEMAKAKLAASKTSGEKSQ